MAFTNLWDQTFPPDVQLASLGAADLRQLRVDTQQRMAAISGLDAAKPAFGSDAQPASWNGVLFFATDTGIIYQWNNPSWTNITASFVKGNVVYKNTTPVTHTGTTTEDTIFTSTALNPLTVNSSYRIQVGFAVSSQGGSSSTYKLKVNGSIVQSTTINSPVGGNGYWFEYILSAAGSGNMAISSREFQGNKFFEGITSGSFAIDLTLGNNTFVLTWTNGTGTDAQTFIQFIIESL